MQKTNLKIKYSFLLALALLVLFFLYNTNKASVTGNKNTDNQIEYHQPDNRPKTGELDFKK